MIEPENFILDSDVFISAKNTYYAFSICPGFWGSLLHYHEIGIIFSIDHVHKELMAGRQGDEVASWIRSSVPSDFFLSTEGSKITDAYQRIIVWALGNQQYSDAAKAKFATEADGWLVACSMVTGHEVVTNEQPSPGSKARILLPDVCNQFNVKYRNTFSLLSHLAPAYSFKQ